MDHRDLHHCFCIVGAHLVVLGQSARPAQPGEGAFDDPALGQHREAVRLGALDHGEHPAKHLPSPIDQAAAVAAVQKHGLQQRVTAEQPQQYGSRAHPILNAGRMHDHRQQQPQGVYRDVALAPFDLLAGIKTALPPFETVLADWESTMATVGWRLRPARPLNCSRRIVRTRSHSPRLRMRRKCEYALIHGPYSLGRLRHWQPVLTTYRMALTTARMPRRTGRPRRVARADASAASIT